MKTIINKLKKIKALAERGVGGEQENAQELLRKLLLDYGLTEEDITDEKKVYIEFKFKGEQEKNIIKSVYSAMVNKWEFKCYLNGKNRYGFDVTNVEKIHMEEAVPFYIKKYRDEVKKMERNIYIAILNKHNLFPTEEKKDKPESNEKSEIDWNLIDVLKDNISGETLTKKIGGNSEK